MGGWDERIMWNLRENVYVRRSILVGKYLLNMGLPQQTPVEKTAYEIETYRLSGKKSSGRSDQ